MSFEARRLMVAYFTEGEEVVCSDEPQQKLPQHMVIAPWFLGETELAAQALEEVATKYRFSIPVATGNLVKVGSAGMGRQVHPERPVRELHKRVVRTLGKYYLALENPDYDFEPVIIIDQEHPKLPGSVDLHIDHLAIVQDLEDGTTTIADCVYME